MEINEEEEDCSKNNQGSFIGALTLIIASYDKTASLAIWGMPNSARTSPSDSDAHKSDVSGPLKMCGIACGATDDKDGDILHKLCVQMASKEL